MTFAMVYLVALMIDLLFQIWRQEEFWQRPQAVGLFPHAALACRHFPGCSGPELSFDPGPLRLYLLWVGLPLLTGVPGTERCPHRSSSRSVRSSRRPCWRLCRMGGAIAGASRRHGDTHRLLDDRGEMMGIAMRARDALMAPPILLCPLSSLGGASIRPLHEFRQRLSMR